MSPLGWSLGIESLGKNCLSYDQCFLFIRFTEVVILAILLHVDNYDDYNMHLQGVTRPLPTLGRGTPKQPQSPDV